MSRKRIHTEAEIESLADMLRPLWRQGDVVRPWLRQHYGMLLELVHGDWSWAAIARAMTLADITYRTGKSWAADWLQSEVYRARQPLKGYRRRPGRSGDAAPEPPPVEAPVTIGAGVVPPAAAAAAPVILPLPPKAVPSVASAPRFKPTSLRVHEPPPVLSEAERAEIERNRRLTFGPPEPKE